MLVCFFAHTRCADTGVQTVIFGQETMQHHDMIAPAFKQSRGKCRTGYMYLRQDMSDLYMQSLWIILLVIFCSFLAANYHTVQIDKTKLEFLLTSLESGKKQLDKRVQIAESNAEKCVQANDACQQQLEKFETLKKTSLLNDDKIDVLKDQLKRQNLKKNHFQSLLNKTQEEQAEQLQAQNQQLEELRKSGQEQVNTIEELRALVQQVKDEVQPVECAVKTNHHQQVQDEVQPNNLDYAQTFIYVVETCIFCLLCVIMYVQCNLYKMQTAESDKFQDFDEEKFKQLLQPAAISCDSNGFVVFDHCSTGIMSPTTSVLHAMGNKYVNNLLRTNKIINRPKRSKKQQETRWAALMAKIWNQVQFHDIESNISTATFYPRSQDTAEYDKNLLDKYRAIPE